VPNFIAIPLQGAFPQICEILRYCDFFVVLSCPGYRPTFFLTTPPRSNPWTDFLTIYDLNDASSPKDVPFGGLDDDHNIKGFKTQKTKGGVVKAFSSQTGKIIKL